MPDSTLRQQIAKQEERVREVERGKRSGDRRKERRALADLYVRAGLNPDGSSRQSASVLHPEKNVEVVTSAQNKPFDYTFYPGAAPAQKPGQGANSPKLVAQRKRETAENDEIAADALSRTSGQGLVPAKTKSEYKQDLAKDRERKFAADQRQAGLAPNGTLNGKPLTSSAPKQGSTKKPKPVLEGTRKAAMLYLDSKLGNDPAYWKKRADIQRRLTEIAPTAYAKAGSLWGYRGGEKVFYEADQIYGYSTDAARSAAREFGFNVNIDRWEASAGNTAAINAFGGAADRQEANRKAEVLHKAGEGINKVLATTPVNALLRNTEAGKLSRSVNESVISGVNPISRAEGITHALMNPVEAVGSLVEDVHNIYGTHKMDGSPVTTADRVQGLITAGSLAAPIAARIGPKLTFAINTVRHGGIRGAQLDAALKEVLHSGVDPKHLAGALGENGPAVVRRISNDVKAPAGKAVGKPPRESSRSTALESKQTPSARLLDPKLFVDQVIPERRFSYEKGKENFLDTLAQEWADPRPGRMFENRQEYNVTRRLIEDMDDSVFEQLHDLGNPGLARKDLPKVELEIHGHLSSPKGSPRGDWNPDRWLIRLSRTSAMAVHKAGLKLIDIESVPRTIMHEIAHRLEDFLDSQDIAALRKQWLFEKERALKNIDSLSAREQAARRYRYSNWHEWWAHTIEDREAFRRIGSFAIDEAHKSKLMRQLAKVVLFGKRMMHETERLALRQGQKDVAGSLYKAIRRLEKVDYGQWSPARMDSIKPRTGR